MNPSSFVCCLTFAAFAYVGTAAAQSNTLNPTPARSSDVTLPTANPSPVPVGTFIQADDPLLIPADQLSRSIISTVNPEPNKPDPALLQSIAQTIDDCLVLLSNKTSAADAQFYENGVWNFKNSEKFPAMQTGPGTAAAVLWKWRRAHLPALDDKAKTKQAGLQQAAIATFDAAIRDHQAADGSFGIKGSSDECYFGVELGTTYLELQDFLPSDTKERWRGSIVRLVNSLVQKGSLPNPAKSGWEATDGRYTNDNVELAEAELAYITWKITGEPQYISLFETQWKHALRPDQGRWPGCGLYYLQPPSQSDGSDGSAYFADENNPAYKPAHTLLDMDILGRLYVVSRDPRVLRLLNLTTNRGLDSTNMDTWLWNTTPFNPCSVVVGAWLGGRTAWLSLLPAQFQKQVRRPYLGNGMERLGQPGMYLGYGASLAVWLQAASLADN